MTEILRKAANHGSHDMASALRELAAAAEALADTADYEPQQLAHRHHTAAGTRFR